MIGINWGSGFYQPIIKYLHLDTRWNGDRYRWFDDSDHGNANPNHLSRQIPNHVCEVRYADSGLEEDDNILVSAIRINLLPSSSKQILPTIYNT